MESQPIGEAESTYILMRFQLTKRLLEIDEQRSFGHAWIVGKRIDRSTLLDDPQSLLCRIRSNQQRSIKLQC